MSSAEKLVACYLLVGVVGHVFAAIGKRYDVAMLEDLGMRLEGMGGDWVKTIGGKRD